MEIPEDLRYTTDHEWARLEGELVRIGITDFAQDALGDVVYVELPDVQAAVRAGAPCGEVESTKSVSELFAPINGTIEEVNRDLEDTPELVNNEPYGSGWIMLIRAEDVTDVDKMRDAAGYRALLDEESA